MKTRLSLLGLALTLAASGAASAADGWKTINAQCIACHAVKKPSAQGLDHIWQRKGPDLYYAGDKFRREWLVRWLQHPTVIRPAGVFYRKAVAAGVKDDTIAKKPARHMPLSGAQARAVADTLMTLHGAKDHIETGAAPKSASGGRIGKLFFVKLRGCAACHQSARGEGGVSGPELYDAGARLQPDYIYSYTKNPQAFDPHVWMPRLELSSRDLGRLTGYLISLDGKEE